MSRETIATDEDVQPVSPKLSMQERAEKFVAERREKYDVVLAAAKEAAETTQTHAWGENYRQQRDQHKRRIREEAYVIESAGKYIGDRDTDETQEKKIKDAIKALIEERINHEAWLARTVNPFSSAVDVCIDLLEATQRESQRIDEGNPLLYAGYAAAVSALVAKWPQPIWHEETGIAEIAQPVADKTPLALHA